MNRKCEKCGATIKTLELLTSLPALDSDFGSSPTSPIRCTCGSTYMFAYPLFAKFAALFLSLVALGLVFAGLAAMPNSLYTPLRGLSPYTQGAVLMSVFIVTTAVSAICVSQLWPLKRWRKKDSD